MSAGLGIIPLVHPSVSPLKGAFCCVLPPLAVLCLLWKARWRMAAAAPMFQTNLMPCCGKRGFAPAQRPPEPCSLRGQSTLREPSLALHLKIIPSIETQAKASCGLWPR